MKITIDTDKFTSLLPSHGRETMHALSERGRVYSYTLKEKLNQTYGQYELSNISTLLVFNGYSFTCFDVRYGIIACVGASPSSYIIHIMQEGGSMLSVTYKQIDRPNSVKKVRVVMYKMMRVVICVLDDNNIDCFILYNNILHSALQNVRLNILNKNIGGVMESGDEDQVDYLH